MDPVTQAALGAACSQAILNKKDRRNAWIAGLFGAVAPDLDVLIQSSHNPMVSFLYHRHFTHALSVIPFGGMIVALVLLSFARFREHKWLTLLAATIGYATHALLDALTSYGTVLLWPFSMHRFSWDIVAIIDPWFTFPLILGLIWTLTFGNRKGVLVGIMVSALVLILNCWQHTRALAITQQYAEEQGMHINTLRAMPNLASRTRWRIVTHVGKELFIANVSTPFFHQSVLTPVAWCPSFDKSDLQQQLDSRQIKDISLFNWFTEGNIIVSHTHPMVLADGRYLTGNNPLIALWGIQVTPGKLFVDKLRRITLDNCHYPKALK